MMTACSILASISICAPSTEASGSRDNHGFDASVDGGFTFGRSMCQSMRREAGAVLNPIEWSPPSAATI